jgi:hypothetical protein
MGQAAGTAAAMAAANGLTPRGVGEKLICELQEKLLRDDCYLPGLVYPVSELTRSAAIQASVGDPEPVRDGVHRAVGEDDHFWECPEGGSITYRLGRRELVHEVTLVLDSSLDKTMGGGGPHCDLSRLPGAFRVERYYNGRWYEVLTAMDNFQRLLRVEVNAPCEAVRFVIDATRGGKSSRLYAFYID